MLKNSDPTLKYTCILAIVPDLIHTYCLPTQNMKHTNSLPALLHVYLQSKLDLESFKKHRFFSPLLLHPQTNDLKMLISFVTGKEQDLNVEP